MNISDSLIELMKLDVGFNVGIELLMLRSLDNGDFAVSYSLEVPENSWEEEFSPETLEKAVEYFLKKKNELYGDS